MGFLGDLFKKPKTDAVFEIKSPNGRVVAIFMLDHGQIFYYVKKDEKVQQIGFIEKVLASKLSPKMRRGAKFNVRIESCGIYMDRPYCELELEGVEYDNDGELVFE